MSVLVGGNRSINRLSNYNIFELLDGSVTIANATTYRVSDATGYDQFTGNFTYDADGRLNGGTITGWTRFTNGGTEFVLTGLNYPVALFLADLATNDSAGLIDAVLGNNDKITGSTAGDVLSGHDGNDTINGGGSGDLIAGSQGNDSLLGGAGQDALAGGDGNDTMVGGADNDTYNGFEIGDVILEAAGQGIDEVHTTQTHILGENIENLVLEGVGNIQGQGNKLGNVITGNSGNNQIAGVEGNDTLDGAGGADTMIGGIGNDVYWINDALDEIQESVSGGTDTARSHIASYTLAANVEILELWSGGVTGKGNDLANLMLGQNGDNVFYGLAGNDTVDAGGGKDYVEGGFDSDSISGGDGDDSLYGEQGTDTLSGDKGDDYIDGGDEIDVMIGGAGGDTYFVRQSGDKIVEAAGAGGGVDGVYASTNYVMAANVEALQLLLDAPGGTVGTGNSLGNTMSANSNDAKFLGLDGDDTLSGFIGNDTLDGGAGDDDLLGDDGNDSLIGGAGVDQLSGQLGDDTMAGGAGNDVYVVASAGDIVTEGAGQGIDVILGLVSYSLSDGSEVEGLSLFGTALTGDGNKYANNVSGNELDNTLTGGAGNDSIRGEGGNDKMQGGTGDDIYTVADAGDTVVEQDGQGNDTVWTAIDNYSLGTTANVENLKLLEGFAAITGTGSGGDNLITGNSDGNKLFALSGKDTVDGGGGHDSIDGSGGNDSLTGGDGTDSLEGGIGDDTMLGGKGSDFYHVDSAKDLVVEAAEPFSVDRLFTTVDNTTLVANVEYLILEGTAVTGFGNALDNLVNGNTNNNKLYGLAGNDSVYGGLGNDLLDGGAGNDALQAAGGADTMIGGAGNDLYLIDNTFGKIIEAAGGGIDGISSDVSTIDLGNYANVENLSFSATTASVGFGNALNNIIEGNNGTDSLVGKDGNDTLNGGAGNDTMDGGAGNDLYLLSDAGDVVVEGVNAGRDTVVVDLPSIDLGSLAYVNIEDVILSFGASSSAQGNDLANKLTGNDQANILLGGVGNDTLMGEAAALNVGGDDVLAGGEGDDLMVGGRGGDVYAVTEAGDKVVELAGQGTDTVVAAISYVLGANLENLSLSGSAAKGTGNALDNTIQGNSGDNSLAGLTGNDTISGALGNDTQDGGAGNDSLSGGAGGDKLIGGAGFNRLQGDDDNDTLIGGVNNDTLDGGIGVDSMAGGGGSDSYFVDSKNDSILEGAGQGADSVFATVDYVLPANVETLYVSGTAQKGTGNAGANSILGNGESNLLIGLAGNDTFFGGIGGEADTMVGGAGSDLYSVDTISDVVDEDPLSGGSGIDTVVASVSISLASLSAHVENVQLTGSAVNATGNALANKIEGTASNNSLSGGAAGDTLIGGDGLDALIGGTGFDVMIGGNGDDEYYVDAVGDKVVEGKGGGSDAVHSFVDYALAAEVETLFLDSGTNGTGNALNNSLLGNASANKLSGLAGGDYIDGKDGNDTLLGGVGDDNLIGGADNDSMVGGAGNDIYSVEQAGDIIFETAGQGIDYVESSLSTYTLGANLEKLNLVGATAVTGIGNGLDNLIYGANFVPVGNVLLGAAGNDTLNGNAEADTLTGGVGRDHFQITATDAVDRVTDFEAGALGDTVDLSDLLTGYVPGASDPNLFVQFVTGGGNTTVRVDADGAGGGAAFQDVVVLEGVMLSNVNQAVLEGNLLLA